MPISQMIVSAGEVYVAGATYDSTFVGTLDVKTGEVTVVFDTFSSVIGGDVRLVALP
jgi:hypothetical protein